MRGPDRLLVALASRSKRPLMVFLLAGLLALLPVPANQARGAGTALRLDWGTKTPMPTARTGLSLVAAPDGLLYAVGGTASGSVGTVEAYAPATNTWASKAPLSKPRTLFGLAVARNGKMYAAGGYFGALLDTVEEYDPATDHWTTRAPLREPRYYFGLAAAPNGKLYAVGGYNGSGILRTVDEYDPATDTWESKAPLPAPRAQLAVATEPNGKLLAIGGYSGSAFLRTVEEYDPASDTWQSRTPISIARSDLALATASNGKLYAVGGFGTPGDCPLSGYCSTVEQYDPDANTWAIRTPLPASRENEGLTLAPNGKLYAVGGRGVTSVLASVDEYDPQTNTWAKAQTAPLPHPRVFPTSAEAGGQFFVFGGGEGINTTNSVFRYDPSTNTWTQMTDMPTTRRGAVAVEAQNGKIYVVGGQGSGPGCTTGVCTTVEEYAPPPDINSGGGTWRGAANGISQLPAGRAFPGIVLGSNGKLYLAGGTDGSVSRGETFEYDPATNSAWQPMATLHVPRTGPGLAQGGDRKLYAVGGVSGNAVFQTVERFVLPSAGNALGTWEGPDGVGQLPFSRGELGVAGLATGQVIQVGGLGVDDSGSNFVSVADVRTFDVTTNSWTSVAPLPSARSALSLTLRGSRQLFAIGGADENGQLSSVVEGDLDQVPSISAGGPYTVPTGQTTVQLTATGSDPDGDPLTFAWDLDGSLRYVGSSRVDLQACKLEYSIVSPK